MFAVDHDRLWRNGPVSSRLPYPANVRSTQYHSMSALLCEGHEASSQSCRDVLPEHNLFAYVRHGFVHRVSLSVRAELDTWMK